MFLKESFIQRSLEGWRGLTNRVGLISIISLLSLLCAIRYTFFKSAPIDFYSIYVIFFLALTFFCSLRSRALRKKTDKIFSKKNIISGTILLLAALLAFYKVNEPSIWLDEEIQFEATKGISQSIVKAAAFTQTPLAYFYTALSVDFFGKNELALRFFSCLFYVGFCGICFNFIYKNCSNKIIATISPLLIVLNPWFIRYAQEGRPYACMLFFSTAWLHFVISRFVIHFPVRQSKSEAIVLLSCTNLLLLSISYQSVIFVISISLAIFFYLFRNQRLAAMHFVISILISLFLIAPVYFLIVNRSSHFIKSNLQLAISFSQLPHFFSSTWPLNSTDGLLLAGIPLSFAFRRGMTKDLIPWKSYTICGILFSSFVCFHLLFFFSYLGLVNFSLSTRYYLIAYPVAILANIFFLDFLIAAFNLEVKIPKLIFSLTVGLFLLCLIFLKRDIFLTYQPKFFSRWNPDQKGLYELFKKEGTLGDEAFLIGIYHPDGWEQIGFMASQFYYPQNSPVRILSHWEQKMDSDTTSQLIVDSIRSKRLRNIFLVFPAREEVSRAINSMTTQNTNIRFLPGYILVKLAYGKNLSRKIESFFEELLSRLPDRQKAYRIYDIILSLYETDGEFKVCDQYLSKLAQLAPLNSGMAGVLKKHELLCHGK